MLLINYWVEVAVVDAGFVPVGVEVGVGGMTGGVVVALLPRPIA